MLQESVIRVPKLDTGSLMKSSRSQRKKLSRNADQLPSVDSAIRTPRVRVGSTQGYLRLEDSLMSDEEAL